MLTFVFFFKQKTAYEMRISDWSSDVCSSDLSLPRAPVAGAAGAAAGAGAETGAVETGGAGAAFFACAAASTSSLVRRPSLPVPLIVEGSTPCSSTARRTAGDMDVAASLTGSGAGLGAGAGAGAGAAARSEETTSELQSLM